MNRVFRSVWNAAIGSWVAVSEMQSSRGKPGRGAAASVPRRGCSGISASLLALSTLSLAAPVFAQATAAGAYKSYQPGTYTTGGGLGLSFVFRAMSQGEAHALGDITLDGTATSGIKGLWALSKGVVRVDGHVESVTTAQGAYAEGVGSQILLTTGTFSVTGAGQNGLQVVDNAQLVSTGTVSVDSDGRGMYVNKGGTITIGQDANVSTHGSRGYGLLVDGSSGSSSIQTAGQALVTTGGDDAVGIYMLGSSSQMVFDMGAEVTTSGDRAAALKIAGGAEFTVGGAMALTTKGSHSSGIQVGDWERDVDTGAVTTVLTKGSLVIEGSLKVDVQGGAIDAAGCEVGAGVCLMGDGSSFIAIEQGEKRITSRGHTIKLTQGDSVNFALKDAYLAGTGALALIDVTDITGSSQLQLENVEIDTQSSGLLLKANANSALEFKVRDSTVSGNIVADLGNEVKMSLSQATSLGGHIQGVHSLSLDGDSSWNVTGTSMLQNLNNAGNISFFPPAPGALHVSKTITVDHYVGQNGWLNVNTYLADDASPSDKLIIDGGTAGGRTAVNVVNSGGLGAPTVNKGIGVIVAVNGATTAADTFYLNGGVVAGGAYDYSLQRNTDNSWYLVSTLARPIPGEPEEHAVRPELSLYSAAPSLAILQGATMLDSLHERKSGEQRMETSEPAGALWTRLVRSQGTVNPVQADQVEGNNFKHHTNGIQIGIDVLHNSRMDSMVSDAGVFFAYADSTSDTKHFDKRKAGRNELKSRSIGAYWTGYLDNGAYIDVVGMHSRHKLNAESMRSLHVSTKGKSTALSVEAGMPFVVSDKWVVEPQVQLRMQRGDLDHTDDAAGLIDFGKIKSLQSRVGVRAAHRSSTGTFWGRVDWLQEMQGKSETSLAAMSGKHGVYAPSSLHGGSLALTTGVNKQVSHSVSVYGSANYQHHFSGRGHGYGVKAGIKFAW